MIAVFAAIVVVVAGVGIYFFLKNDNQEYNELTVNMSGDGIVQIRGTDFTAVVDDTSVISIPKQLSSVTLVAIDADNRFEKWSLGSKDVFVNTDSIDINGDMEVSVLFSKDVELRYNVISFDTTNVGIAEISGTNYNQSIYYNGSIVNIPNNISSVTLTAESLVSTFEKWVINSNELYEQQVTVPLSNGDKVSVKYDKIFDARGRLVEIPDNIDSILAIKSCSLQLVSYFDAVEKITHLDTNESFKGTDNRTHTFILADMLSNLPKVDPSNTEQVIATGVDLIISSTTSVSDLNKEQSDYGVPVFAINADVEFGSDIYFNQILMLGDLLDEKERANEIVNGIINMINDIYNNVEPIEDMTGYACGMNFYGAGGFLKVTGDYLPFEYSKLMNSFVSSNNKQPYNTDIETVISKNPSIIFIDGGGLSSAVSYIKENKGTLNVIDAISGDNVYKTMAYKSWGTNWINQLINVYFVASVLHPDSFDWEFESQANKIIQLFYPGTSVTYSDIANAQTGGGCGKVSL